MFTFNETAKMGYKEINVNTIEFPKLEDGKYAQSIQMTADFRDSEIEIGNDDDSVYISGHAVHIGQRVGHMTFRFYFDGSLAYEQSIFRSDFTQKQNETLKKECQQIAKDYQNKYKEIVKYNAAAYIQNNVNRQIEKITKLKAEITEETKKLKAIRKNK